MKKIVLLIAVMFSVCTAVRAASPRDVLAQSCGEWTWFAHVTRTTGTAPADMPASNEQTELFALQNAPGQQWRSLPTLPGRAVSLATRSSQLAVLMADGQWLTLWSDGSATGQPLPAGGRIKAFADDGSSLWAIGSVNGGIAAADREIARDAAQTQPTTFPSEVDASVAASTLPVEPRVVRSIPAKMVLFRETNGRWATVTEMAPDAFMTPDEEISLTVVGDVPMISFKTGDGKLRTQRYTAQHIWEDVGWITASDNLSISGFCLLTDGFKPYLWWTNGNSPGELLPDAANGSKTVVLQWMGNKQLDGIPAAAFAGGYFCLFGPHADKVLEQRYKENGTPVETAGEINVQPHSSDSLLPQWLQVVFLTSMGFSVGASVFRQWAEPPKMREMDIPIPAPLFPRFAAGLLDALPVLGALFYLGIKTDALSNVTDIPALKYSIIFVSAVVIYLLHTTLTEVFTGRSAGKWVFGLKVVTTEGAVPTRSQYLLRNLLRVIDPLITIIISPQRQRSADTVAGTMVVSLFPPEDPGDDEFEDQG